MFGDCHGPVSTTNSGNWRRNREFPLKGHADSGFFALLRNTSASALPHHGSGFRTIAVMPTTLFEAPPYDPRRDRRRNRIIVAAIVGVIVLGAALYFFRNLPYERVVDRFFTALEEKNYE